MTEREERTYTVGIMNVDVTGTAAETRNLVHRARVFVERTLQLGLTEKTERHLDFLPVVADVDLGAANRAYGLTFPSQLVNVGVVSLRRLSPAFRGEAHDEERTAHRLAGLLLHTLGHLLNLPPTRDPDNVMYAFREIEDLEGMRHLTAEQVRRTARSLPRETRDRSTRTGALPFTLRMFVLNLPGVVRAVARANPFAMAFAVPSMLTTALSVALVFFFTAEIWDIASTVEVYEVLLFSVLTVAISTWVPLQGFTLTPGGAQRRAVTEPMVTARAAVLIALVLTVLVFYGLLAALTLVGAATFFPHAPMETWPTADPATGFLEHLKLALILGAIGALTGGLGALGSSSALSRRVLFVTRARS